MADYLSILKKTIDGLPNNSTEIRQAVYRKARTTIEAQLRGINPPLSDAVIGAQLQSLEEAILIADSEYATAEPENDADITIVIDEPEVASVPQDEQVGSNESVADEILLDEDVASPPDSVGISDDVTAVTEPNPDIEEAPYVPAGSAEVPEVAFETSVADEEGQKPTEKKSTLGKVRRLLVPMVVLLIIGASGYGLWSNRASLEPMVMSWISGSQTSAGSQEPEQQPISQDEQTLNEDAVAESKKDDVKLAGESDGVTQEEESIVSLEPADEPIDLIESETPSVETVPDEQIVEEQPVQEVEDVDSDTQSQTSDNEPAPIGEIAYLYEEGNAGAGATRSNASVAWSTKMERLSDNLPEERVIVASMEVPEKALSMEMEIKRNVDSSISASHIIEIRFKVPDGFSGSGIDNISRFVLKSTEEARGEPLVAVPVKVSEGFFLVAMDNLQQAVDVNTQLLLESSWIDMPISYSTSKRALVTLAKGETGTQVFKDAFADWQNR